MSYLDDVLGEGGVLATALPGFAVRDGQLDLARAIDRAFRDGANLLAEAGTGTGKSVAYCVPAVFAAAGEDFGGRKVCVATANIALQEQLVGKDLPMLASVLPWPFRYALAKGRANYLCVVGSTRVITRDGVREIRALAGGVQTLMDGDGRWVDAEVNSYGRALVYEIALRRGPARMVVRATPDHRWFVQEHQDGGHVERTSAKLRAGDRLACVYPRNISTGLRPSPFGIAHGAVFGDGTVFGETTGGWRTATVTLHGEKRELLRFFPLSHVLPVKLGEEYAEREASRVCDLPRFFKELPSLEEAPSYLYGWLAGYFATDGCVSEDGKSFTLPSSRRENVEFVQTVCARLGIATGLIGTAERVGIGQTEPSKMFVISLVASTLSADFFLRSKHCARFLGQKKRAKLGRLRWTVESVTDEGHAEEVFCAVVPSTRSFVLEGNLLTGNCLARSDDVAAEMVLAGLAGERDEFARVQGWADHTETGDLSELPFEMAPDLRRRLTVTADECVGKSCERYADCYANKAYRALPDAHVVVTNMHLLLAHLVVLRATNGEAGILPSFDYLVIDEVHRFAEIARDFLGFRVTPGSVRWAAKLLAGAKGKRALDPIDPDLKRRLDDAAGGFEHFLRVTRRSPDYRARIREPLRDDGWRRVTDLLREAGSAYLRTAAARALPTGRKVEIIKQGVRAGLLADQIEEAVTVKRAERCVYFIDEDDRGRVSLSSKPISVADDLRAMLFGGEAPKDDAGAYEVVGAKEVAPGASYADVTGFSDVDGAHRYADGADEPEEDVPPPLPRRAVKAVVGTSATIRTGSSFGYVKRELGAESARELVAASPFDHYEQALLVFPEGMPDPRERNYVEAVAATFSEVVGLAGGRTLGLFTSYKSLAVAHERVRAEHGGRFRIMRQGEAPRTQLVRAFREDVSSVLLGTESFSEGVDVPGEALSVVFIDKLPFAPPDDPVLDALQDAYPRDWFQRYSIPRAVISFRQRVGRLIRSVSDKGVVVVCDPRVLGKGYGRTFLRSLPEMRVSQKLTDVALFLAQTPKAREEPRDSSALAPQRPPVPAAVDPYSKAVDEGLRAIVSQAAGRRRRSTAKG